MTVADLKLPWETTSMPAIREPDPSHLEALETLANGDADVSARAVSLFMFLAKISGQDNVKEHLALIQQWGVEGTPAGARLLAAFLDVASPGDRLLPRVRRFTSSRRLVIRLGNDPDDPGKFHEDWLERLELLTERSAHLAARHDSPDAGAICRSGDEAPWPQFRDALEVLWARLNLGDAFDPDDRSLLVELLRLEVDARQERISHLAGSVDLSRVGTIRGVLPLLNLADAEIRDLRWVISAIEEDVLGGEFHRPVSRARVVLEESDRAALAEVLERDPDLAPLAGLFAGLDEHPVPVPVLASGLQGLQALARRLDRLGVPDADLDPVTGVRLVQTAHVRDGETDRFRIPLTPGFAEVCTAILASPVEGKGAAGEDLAGLAIRDGELVITVPEGGSYLEHDLPAAAATDEADEIGAWADDLLAEEGEAPQDGAADQDEEKFDPNSATVSELKHLVMTNIQSVSVLLGFLRNPKVVAIPGLVEEVVNRTRNPIVIETICGVRALHSGFANRGVPLAVLRSPVNIPLGVLRKFMHVKYVSKVDLKRMALDKTGIRKEVGREIGKYLKSLA